MLHSRNKTLESLVEKYKGPGYCISRYHGNADVCFNVRNLIWEFQSRLSFYLTRQRIEDNMKVAITKEQISQFV